MIVPVAAGKTVDTTTYARRITRYKVHAGDTVESVAENFGVSAQMVRRWNGLHGDSLKGRKVLALHLPVTPNSETPSTVSRTAARTKQTSQTASAKAARPATRSKKPMAEAPTQVAVVHHTVKSGETLYSIATAYKTTVAALKRTNGDISILRPGVILVVQPSR